MVTYDDFKKLEIRIGEIVFAEKLENADKLLKLQLDFGEFKRQILTAMAEYYPDPKVLIGKQIPVLINLEPRNMKGEISEGMLIATDKDDKPLFIIPEEKVPNGSLIR